MPGVSCGPDLHVGGGSEALRKTLKPFPILNRRPNNEQQRHECCNTGEPSYSLTRQSASQAETNEAQQERQIFEVSESTYFDGNPADERQFRKQREKAGEQEVAEFPVRIGARRENCSTAPLGKKQYNAD